MASTSPLPRCTVSIRDRGSGCDPADWSAVSGKAVPALALAGWGFACSGGAASGWTANARSRRSLANIGLVSLITSGLSGAARGVGFAPTRRIAAFLGPAFRRFWVAFLRVATFRGFLDLFATDLAVTTPHSAFSGHGMVRITAPLAGGKIRCGGNAGGVGVSSRKASFVRGMVRLMAGGGERQRDFERCASVVPPGARFHVDEC